MFWHVVEITPRIVHHLFEVNSLYLHRRIKNDFHFLTSWCCIVLRISIGVLLVGPPGVGKTYAVKAVEAMCADICKVATTFLFFNKSCLLVYFFIYSDSDTDI